MKWFLNYKVATKLFINLGLSIAITVTLCVLAYYQMNNLSAIQDEGYSRSEDSINAHDASGIAEDLYSVIADSIINRNIEESSRLWAETKNTKVQQINEVLATADTEEEQKMKKTTLTALNELISIYEDELVPKLKTTTLITDEIKSLDGRIDDKKIIISDEMDKFSKSLFQEAVLADKSFDEIAKNALEVNVTISIVAIILLFGISLYIITTIKNPLIKLTNALSRVAERDLNVTVDINTKDDIGIMANAFRLVIDNLNEALGNIYASSVQVSTGANQVSMSGQALSQGSTEQASSIEQITSSITEIAAQTKQNAINANEASDLASSAKENAITGNQQMAQMLSSMGEINESSNDISRIIKVIDEIAFQTNILALNAAVEAARAGQHGKGFAVVAEEVRSLAGRSADAARETTALIEGSIKKVDLGTRIANNTAEALDKIVSVIAKTSDLVSGIASASNEQASGISQINTAIDQVSQVTQTNSASAEESAAASEELSSQAELLMEIVGQFNLKKSSYNRNNQGDNDIPMYTRKNKMIENRDVSNRHNKNSSEKVLVGKKSQTISLSENDFGKY